MLILQAIRLNILVATRVLVLMIGLCVCAIPVAAQKFEAPLANPDLDQCANGQLITPAPSPLPCTGSRWQNGNLNSNNSQYIEGQSVTYRAINSGVAGGSGSLTIEYDTTKGGKRAIDYLTTYDRSNPTANDPCDGVAGCSLGTFTTFPIPIDGDVTNGPNGVPGGGDDITQIPGVFTLFGGTITGVSGYTLAGSYAGDSSRFITVNFTFGATGKVVLAWGGHISIRGDWGIGNTAIAISGAPYHTTVNNGPQASMQVEALIVPGSVKIVKLVNNLSGSYSNLFTSFGFLTTGAPVFPANFSLMDTDPAQFGGGSITNSSVIGFGAANTITVREPVLLNGYSALTYVCVEDPGGLPQLDNSTTTIDIVNGATATIIVEEGEIITCTLTNTQVTPSAASVPISGRVLTSTGRGISSVRVTLTDDEGFTRTAISSSFGYYRFEGVEVGRVYVMSALSKRFQFSPQVISLTDELSGFNLIAQE